MTIPGAEGSPWAADAVCMPPAPNSVDDAAALLRGALPREWRSTSARAFVHGLEDVAAEVERASWETTAAFGLVRAYEAELVQARAALGPFGAWGPAA